MLLEEGLRSGAALQEQYDLDKPMDGEARKLINAAGAGRSVTSPGWLTELGRLWGGKSVRLMHQLQRDADAQKLCNSSRRAHRQP